MGCEPRTSVHLLRQAGSTAGNRGGKLFKLFETLSLLFRWKPLSAASRVQSCSLPREIKVAESPRRPLGKWRSHGGGRGPGSPVRGTGDRRRVAGSRAVYPRYESAAERISPSSLFSLPFFFFFSSYDFSSNPPGNRQSKRVSMFPSGGGSKAIRLEWSS